MKNKKQKIEIEYNSLDIWAIDRYSKFIDKHLKLGNKIPARVLIKFGSFFTNPNLAIKKESENKIQEIKTLVYNKFSAQKEYGFNKKLEPINLFIFENKKVDFKGKPNKVNCNFIELLNYVFRKGVELKFKKTTSKDGFIKFIYSEINNYFSQFKGDTLKLFSYRQRCIIAGYTAICFGYSLTNTAPVTNEVIFQSTRHAINKKSKA